jgi:N-acetyl sugar amidotransferase
MDKSAVEITFDENGVCSFCHQAQRELQMLKYLRLPDCVNPIYEAGKGKKYDVLIGLSGGVDSSYALHCAVSLGLRPLCFSVDNGWNTPVADENIMRLVETLKVPFYRYTIDRKKFLDLQSAFMRAGLPNLEIPTDHILMATTLEMAAKNGIKYVLSGGNVATESIMPPSWGYNARDLVHIKDVYRRMTGKKLTGLPVCSLLKWNWYRWVKKIKTVYLLDYLDFNRNEAAALLAEKYGWQEYGEKHCESVFTAWFQNFYLFEKFGFDKRKAHLSALINSGQMTRDEALEELGRERYYKPIGEELRIMGYPKRSHDEFKKDHFVLVSKLVKPFIWNS